MRHSRRPNHAIRHVLPICRLEFQPFTHGLAWLKVDARPLRYDDRCTGARIAAGSELVAAKREGTEMAYGAVGRAAMTAAANTTRNAFSSVSVRSTIWKAGDASTIAAMSRLWPLANR